MRSFDRTTLIMVGIIGVLLALALYIIIDGPVTVERAPQAERVSETEPEMRVVYERSFELSKQSKGRYFILENEVRCVVVSTFLGITYDTAHVSLECDFKDDQMQRSER